MRHRPQQPTPTQISTRGKVPLRSQCEHLSPGRPGGRFFFGQFTSTKRLGTAAGDAYLISHLQTTRPSNSPSPGKMEHPDQHMQDMRSCRQARRMSAPLYECAPPRTRELQSRPAVAGETVYRRHTLPKGEKPQLEWENPSLLGCHIHLRGNFTEIGQSRLST